MVGKERLRLLVQPFNVQNLAKITEIKKTICLLFSFNHS